jgi:hypothetical protein
VLCLLDTGGASRLAAIGPGAITAAGGGIVVNSDDPAALVAVGGDIVADQIRVVGGFSDGIGGGGFLPTPEEGGPPAIDPLADLPTPDELIPPPPLRFNTAQTVSADTTFQPGIYTSVTVNGGATVTLEAGVYVFRATTGLTIRDNATVVGDGVTIYLACNAYPGPCSGPGARFRVQDGGQFLAGPPSVGEYAGLSIFADRGNTRTMRLRSSRDLNLAGALYGPSTPVRMESTGDLTVNSLMAVDSLALLSVSGPDPSVNVRYNPSLPIPGIGVPVLIR